MYNDAGINHGLMLDETRPGKTFEPWREFRFCFTRERFEYGLSIDVLGRLVEVVSE